MKIKDVYNVIYSPLVTSRILHSVVTGAMKSNELGLKTELMYLCLPFIYDSVIRKKLNTSNSRSTFDSVFDEIEIRNSLICKDKEITKFYGLTNDALIFLSSSYSIEVGSHIKIHSNDDEVQRLSGFSLDKPSYQLGLILGKESAVSVIQKVGVKTLWSQF